MRDGEKRLWARGREEEEETKRVSVLADIAMYRRKFPSFALFTPTLLSCEKLRVEIVERESNNVEVTTRHTLQSSGSACWSVLMTLISISLFFVVRSHTHAFLSKLMGRNDRTRKVSRRLLSVERKVVLRFASRDSVKPAGLVDARACVLAGERVLVRVCVVE